MAFAFQYIALCSGLPWLLMTWPLSGSSLSADLRNCCPATEALQRRQNVTYAICKLIFGSKRIAGVAAQSSCIEGSNKQAV